MTKRKLLTRSQLDDWLNASLQLMDGCAESTLSVQHVLTPQSVDGCDGCNWTGMVQIGTTADGPTVLAHAQSIVERARMAFNLKAAPHLPQRLSGK